MLVLGVQVLLGFSFQVFLTPQYDRLPSGERIVMGATLGLLLVALVLLLVPSAHHRIVDRGEDTPSLDAVTQCSLQLALAPLAMALAGASFVVGARDASRGVAAALTGVVLAGAIGAWYLLPLRKRRAPREEPREPMEEISVKGKITHVLTELRVVLPGTQALLGFQLVAVFQAEFDRLPPAGRAAHLAGFALLAASVLLLLFPAAFHRIAERGEPSERLHQVSSVVLVLAMCTLAGAIGCDVFLVVYRVTGAFPPALFAAGVWLTFSLSAWIFGMFLVRWWEERAQEKSLGNQPETGRSSTFV